MSLASVVETCDSWTDDLDALRTVLQKWVVGRSAVEQSLVGILCRQMRTLQLDPHRSGLRELMRATMQQLVSEQQIGR